MNVTKKGEDLREDEVLMLDLKEGNEQAVTRLYKLYRVEFFKWAQSHYQMDEDSCADIFQDAVINLFLKGKQGKLSGVSCSVKTYLFAIGKNLMLNHLSKQRRMREHNELYTALQEDPFYFGEGPENPRKKMVIYLLERLGEPCKSILRLFYYHSLSMSEIADELKYKNEQVVKSQKARCMKELKQQVKEKLNYPS